MYVRPRFRFRPRNAGGAGGSGFLSTTGPTLDLVFAAPSSSGIPVAIDNDSLDLNFITQTYQVAVQYQVWE